MDTNNIDSIAVAEVPPQVNDITETLEALRRKHAELKTVLAYQRQENAIYKIRHKNLSQRVNNVNTWLEKNAQSFYSLFEDTKNALHMGRSALLGTAGPEHVPSLKAGPSGTVTSRRKLHIERIAMVDIQKSLENEVPHAIETNLTQENAITTTAEVNGNNSDTRDIRKRLSVRLSRLPYNIVEEHLKKSLKNISSTVSSIDLTSSFTQNNGPELTSTPLKLETMRNLGLYPTGSIPPNDFVSKRKKTRDCNKVEYSKGLKRSSLKVEKESPLQKKKKVQDKMATPKTAKKKSKKLKTPKTEAVPRSPKVRKAKPVQLKEPSLNKKMRAEK